MRENNAEITFKHCGYECEVRIINDDHRSGYVAVGNGHPLYKVDYSCVPDDFDPNVNGGLTYSRQEEEDWVFGFDFAHCWNIPDLAICKDKDAAEKARIVRKYEKGARTDTLEEAIKDCKNLAEALKEYESKEYVYTLDEWNYHSDREPDAIVCKGIRYEKEDGECNRAFKWRRVEKTEVSGPSKILDEIPDSAPAPEEAVIPVLLYLPVDDVSIAVAKRLTESANLGRMRMALYEDGERIN